MDFLKVFLYKIMTLKEFLKENKISVTPDQRSKLGLLLSTKNDSNGQVEEDGYIVKDYKESFLKRVDTTSKIIKFLNV